MRSLIVFGITFLFLTIIASSFCIDANRNFENKSIEKSEIKPLENHREIITYKVGSSDPRNVTFKGHGIIYFEMGGKTIFI